MFDIDNFKSINDTYSHIAGDSVLHAVVKVCQQNIREIDILGRYGGDEFVILMPGSSFENTFHKGKWLCELVRRISFPAGEGHFHATISVGVANHGPEMLKLEELLQMADLALYAAKQAGRNSVHN